MFGEMIPQLKQALAMGLEIHFRSVANSVFVDLVVSGMIGQQVQQGFGMFNLNNQMFSGNSNFHVTSGWTPTNIIEKTLEDNIFNACHLRCEGSGEFTQVKVFLNAVTTVLSSQGANLPNKFKPLIMGLKIFSCLRKYDFDLKYSSKDTLSLIKDAINLKHSDGYSQMNEKFSGFQQMAGGMMEQGKGMVMFIADYLDTIKAINFDNISINFTLNQMKIFYKLAIHLPGVTSFLNENFLN